jgi:hypothetical protein
MRGQRYVLWRRLRAAVRAGDNEGAHTLAVALGYTNKRNRDRLIEQVWKSVSRKPARV